MDPDQLSGRAAGASETHLSADDDLHGSHRSPQWAAVGYPPESYLNPSMILSNFWSEE